MPAPESIQADEVEAGLKAVFGADSSVLARLAPDGHLAPVPLPVGDGEDAKPLAIGGVREGRYQVTGEVARGGVGIVMRGHDVDLGRDVAMKVIREEHAGDPDVLQRFVEEAQIGGQLQHPGIVPVYEIGLDGDGRPFFTMKLVKGDTLASLLKNRAGPADDLHRLLRIFEAVCETMAYAHARGVIHRDLKPANVMTGAFGEVLVVDWGMGKVLRSGGTADEQRTARSEIDASMIATFRSEGSGTDSVVGSVMGTPQYMPPEQARGDIDAVDERSDVFSLGAILCEILTGKPPFTGKGHEALMQAGRADLEDALARLDACAADEALVDLCRQCLAPAPGVRPQHAGQLSGLIGDHLAGVEERGRAARIEAAEAEVRVTEERRRRKVSLALAAAVLAIIGVGGGGWWWSSQAEAARAATAERAVTAAIERAVRLQGEAIAADEPAAFDPAASALTEAEAVLAAHQADDTQRARVASLKTALAADRATAKAHAAQRARDADLVAFVAEHRASTPDPTRAVVIRTRLFELLAQYGIDPVSGTDAEIRAALDRSPRKADLWAALKLLAGVETVESMGTYGSISEQGARLEAKGAGPLKQLADRLTDDPWEVRWRDAADMQAVLAIADDPALLERGAGDIGGVANFLIRKGELKRGRQLLSMAAEQHPDSFELAAAALHAFASEAPVDPAAAVRYGGTCVALQPWSSSAHQGLATALYLAGYLDDAIETTRTALRLSKDDSQRALIATSLVTFLMDRQGGEEVLEAATQLVRDHPDFAPGLSTLAVVHQVEGRFEAARDAAERSVELDPAYIEGWLILAKAHAKLEAFAASEAALRKVLSIQADHPRALGMLAYFATNRLEYEKAIVMLRRALAGGGPGRHAHAIDLAACLLGVGQVDEAELVIDKLLPEIEALSAGLGSGRRLAGVLLMKGDVLRVRGRLPEAEAVARRAMEADPSYSKPPSFLALILVAAGRIPEAVAAVRTAIRLDPTEAMHHDRLGYVLTIGGGGPAEALAAYREALRLNPDFTLALLNSFGPLAQLGDVVGAMDVAKRVAALPLGPHAHMARLNLGIAASALTRYDEARTGFDEARKATPAYVWAGLARIGTLSRLARVEEAERELPAWVARIEEMPPGPRKDIEVNRLAETRAELALDRRYEAYLRGEDQPRAPAEFLHFGMRARWRGQHERAVALFRDAERTLGAAWAHPGGDQRWCAASSAVASGQHALALAWLQGELQQARAFLSQETDEGRLRGQARARLLLYVEDFAAVRDPEAIKKLPAAQQAAWTKLWDDLRKVRGE